LSRRKRNKVESEDKAEIDLTPMLDVVFIMLIFFIVTASFLKEQSININVPENNDQPPPPDAESKNILISVNASDDVYIDQRRVTISAVRSLIAQKSAENPEGGVVIRAHEQSSTRTYVAIADAARSAKVFNVSLVPYAD